MVWGTFTLQHILSLLCIIIFATTLYFSLRRASNRIKTAVLFFVSLFGVVAIIFDIVHWGQPLLYLPLHLCSLNALIIPFAVLTKSKLLSHLTLVWSLGAMTVLIVNTGQAHYLMFSEAFWVFIIGLTEFDIKKAPATMGSTMAIYTCVHFINIGINNYLSSQAMNIVLYSRSIEVPKVNYMYSLGDEGNAVFALFRKIIPFDYWHMYLIAPIIVLFLFTVHRIISIRKNKKEKAVLSSENAEKLICKITDGLNGEKQGYITDIVAPENSE